MFLRCLTVLFLLCSVHGAQLQSKVWVVRPGTTSSGAASIRYLDASGASIAEEALAPTQDFLESLDRYGSALAELGDLDGNGANDLAVGVPGDDRPGASKAPSGCSS